METTSKTRLREAERERASGPRRRVTEVPREVLDWFSRQSPQEPALARELARAELTARRDGYVTRWVRLWVCQLLEPGDGEVLIATADYVTLEGTPGTDPRARQVERRLLRTEGRDGPGCVISWERVWVCQLLEPDGVTVIGQGGGWAVSPAGPVARWVAAELALDAGI